MLRWSIRIAGIIVVVVALSAAAWTLLAQGAKKDGGMGTDSLAGTSWKLEQFGDGTPLAVGRAPTLAFDAGGARAGGSGGVNRFAGQATVSGESLAFGPLASTRMAGPPDLMAQEDAFFKAIEKTATYKIAADQLTLLDTGGQALLVFAKDKA